MFDPEPEAMVNLVVIRHNEVVGMSKSARPFWFPHSGSSRSDTLRSPFRLSRFSSSQLVAINGACMHWLTCWPNGWVKVCAGPHSQMFHVWLWGSIVAKWWLAFIGDGNFMLLPAALLGANCGQNLQHTGLCKPHYCGRLGSGYEAARICPTMFHLAMIRSRPLRNPWVGVERKKFLVMVSLIFIAPWHLVIASHAFSKWLIARKREMCLLCIVCYQGPWWLHSPDLARLLNEMGRKAAWPPYLRFTDQHLHHFRGKQEAFTPTLSHSRGICSSLNVKNNYNILIEKYFRLTQKQKLFSVDFFRNYWANFSEIFRKHGFKYAAYLYFFSSRFL